MPVLLLTGGIHHYWAMSCRFVLYHILIKTKWICPPGSQDEWLGCLLPLTSATNRVDFCLWARQQAGLDSNNSSTTSCSSGNKKCLNPWALLQRFLFLTYFVACHLNYNPLILLHSSTFVSSSRLFNSSGMSLSWRFNLHEKLTNSSN